MAMMENRKKIHEILDVVLWGNGLEARKKEITGNMPTVFMSFSGHVATIFVEIHANGWDAGEDATASFSFRIDEDIPSEKLDFLREVMRLALNKEDE